MTPRFHPWRFVLFLLLLAFFGVFSGCSTATSPGTVTPSQQLVANDVEDLISIGLVPVLTRNPSYIAAARTVAASLGTFSGDVVTPDDVSAVLAKVPQLSDADRQTIAGVVNAAWTVYVKRHSQQVNANIRPDVKLFLSAVSNGIIAAAAAVPPRPEVVSPAPPVAVVPLRNTEDLIETLDPTQKASWHRF